MKEILKATLDKIFIVTDGLNRQKSEKEDCIYVLRVKDGKGNQRMLSVVWGSSCFLNPESLLVGQIYVFSCIEPSVEVYVDEVFGPCQLCANVLPSHYIDDDSDD